MVTFIGFCITSIYNCGCLYELQIHIQDAILICVALVPCKSGSWPSAIYIHCMCMHVKFDLDRYLCIASGY